MSDGYKGEVTVESTKAQKRANSFKCEIRLRGYGMLEIVPADMACETAEDAVRAYIDRKQERIDALMNDIKKEEVFIQKAKKLL